MKKSKKFVLAGLALLAITMVLLPLAGCKNDTVSEPTRYTVKFETDHGTAPADITVVSGTKLTAEQLEGLADTADYIFEGWYDGETKAEGGTYTVTKGVTLVAKWRDRGTVATVAFTPDGSALDYGDTVTLSSQEGATIHYTVNDGEEKTGDSPVTVSVTGDTTITTITARATKDGLKDSGETKATYTVRKLEGITVTTLPAQTVYSVRQSFDPTGMVVTATYDDKSQREVTGWTTNFDTVADVKGLNKPVTVSYKEGETPKTTTFTITVFPEEVKVLTNYTSPNNTGSGGTYVAFGEWPQTEAVNFKPTTDSQSYGIFVDTYYVEGNDKYVKEGGKYYKVEPIVWRVLTTSYEAPEGGTVGEILLLAENILTGGIPFYVNIDQRKIGEQTVYPNNWQYSTIRAWLNGLDVVKSDDVQKNDKTYAGKGFLQTAFTADAQSLIADTSVDNSAASTIPSGITGEPLESDWNDGVNRYASDTPTTDKVFLLSEEEATTLNSGFGAYDDVDIARIRVTTDYAKATGASQDSTSGWWWLRSPYCSREELARGINDDGGADSYYFVILTYGGVVPALSISLQ